jgi:multiple sugar transport system substrate-binding protein
VSKRTSRREFLAGAAALASAIVLAGCTPATPEPETPTPKVEAPTAAAKALAKPVEVRWHAASGGYGDWSAKRAEVFNKQQDKVVVKVEPYPEYKTKLLSMSTTGLIGDGFWHWDVEGWMAEWAHLGVSRPCDDLIDADDYDMGVYYPASVDGITFQGRTMGLPLHAHGAHSQFFYNEQMLGEAGIEPPGVDPDWSLDDLVENAKKLTIVEGNEVVQWGWMSIRVYHALNCWVRIFGGDYLTPDGTKSILNSSEAKEAYQYLVDAIYTNKIEPEPTGDSLLLGDWRAMFAAGKLAMAQAGGHAGAGVRREVGDKFTWNAAVLPAGPRGDRGAQITTHVGSITCASKQPQAIWEFLKFLSSHESGVDKVLEGAGAPGARPDCFEDPKVLENNPEFKSVALAMKLGKPDVIAANLRGTEVRKAIDMEFGDMWLNKQSPEEAADRVSKAVQQVLDKDPAPGSECM